MPALVNSSLNQEAQLPNMSFTVDTGMQERICNEIAKNLLAYQEDQRLHVAQKNQDNSIVKVLAAADSCVATNHLLRSRHLELKFKEMQPKSKA